MRSGSGWPTADGYGARTRRITQRMMAEAREDGVEVFVEGIGVPDAVDSA